MTSPTQRASACCNEAMDRSTRVRSIPHAGAACTDLSDAWRASQTLAFSSQATMPTGEEWQRQRRRSPNWRSTISGRFPTASIHIVLCFVSRSMIVRYRTLYVLEDGRGCAGHDTEGAMVEFFR